MKKYFLISICIIGCIVRLFSQQQFILQSDKLTKADTIWVFTPADYDENIHQNYPAIYLLHGWSGTYHQWNDIIDCQEYADDYGFIIICPDGLFDSWYIDSPVPGENQMESFFVTELLPFISDNFRIQQQNVFITGLSMGGYGALYLFAMHSDSFKSAGSLSGLLQLDAWRHYYGIDRILGIEGNGKDNKLLSDYSVSGNIDKIKSAHKKIIVSCGTEDPFYTINQTFVTTCKRNNIDVFFTTSPGGHSGAYWASAIGEQFDFFRKLAGGVDK